MTDDYVDSTLRGFPLLPVPETLQEKLDRLIQLVENNELYQEDASTGSSGKPSKEG